MSLLGEVPSPPPQKPAEGDFGYLRWKKPVACSREELILRVARGALPLIRSVWTPESPHLVSVNEVPFLQEALRRQTASGLKVVFAVRLAATLLFGGLTLLGWSFGAFASLAFLAFALSLINCLLTARDIRRLTSRD